LILPAVFEKEPSARISTTGLGIFGIALLTAGFSLTGLTCFAVRHPLFQVDVVFIPSLVVSIIGLLVVLFDFLVFDRYTWGTPSLLLTIAAGVAALTYGSFLILAQRRTRTIRKGGNAALMMPHSSTTGLVLEEVESGRWQNAAYYDNYVRNMFPTSINTPPNARPSNNNSSSSSSRNNNTAYDPTTITEEEMQRQQMLQLLLRGADNRPAATSHSERTFHIDWQQGRDEDDTGHPPLPPPGRSGSHSVSTPPPPSRGYYAPTSHHGASQSLSSVNTDYQQSTSQSTMQQQQHHQQPPPPLLRRITGDLQPWDGVWRTAAPVGGAGATATTSSTAATTPAATAAWERSGREARRLEIERGR
jgi:hypothetical protein